MTKKQFFTVLKNIEYFSKDARKIIDPLLMKNKNTNSLYLSIYGYMATLERIVTLYYSNVLTDRKPKYEELSETLEEGAQFCCDYACDLLEQNDCQEKYYNVIHTCEMIFKHSLDFERQIFAEETDIDDRFEI